MNRKVVGVFDNAADAQSAQRDLMQAGFPAGNISLVTQQGNKEESESFWDKVRDFFGGRDTNYYTEAARRGGTVVTVDCPEDQVQRAMDILQRHNPVDIDRRAEEWRRTGWQPTAQATTAQQTTAQQTRQGEQAIPVVEEQLQVGKQAEQRGGVRVYSHVTEKPVEQQVTLREEHVNVERRPADRPAGPEAFRERTIEAHETREQPVVHKEARVVGEVVVKKDVDQRTETVRDNVRRTDVDVQRLDDDFHKHHQQTYANTGAAYDQYKPAYEYGRQLAEDQRYRGRDWPTVEPEARKSFEQRYPGRWNQMKDAVRWSYDRCRTHPAGTATTSTNPAGTR